MSKFHFSKRCMSEIPNPEGHNSKSNSSGDFPLDVFSTRESLQCGPMGTKGSKNQIQKNQIPTSESGHGDPE